MPRIALAVALLVASGCTHDDLFRPPTDTTKPPLGSGVFHRVTRNPGNDLYPSWLPDDSGVSYAFEPADVVTPDRCVGTTAAEGGTRRPWTCLGHAVGDSVANSNWPVVAADGRAAYVWEPFRPYPSSPKPDSALVFVDGRVVYTFPYFVPGVGVYTTATHLGWLNRDTIVAVAASDLLIRDCGACAFRWVRIGRSVVLLDLTTTPAGLTIVAGTTAASAVTPGATGDDIYFTVAGDTRVYHRVLSSGNTTVTHDFGGAGIARDVQRSGARLIAIVGGSVAFHVDSSAGPIQDDSGGALHMVDLGAGTDSVLPDSGTTFRHPSLSSTGDRLVVEGWLAGVADLWFFRLP